MGKRHPLEKALTEFKRKFYAFLEMVFYYGQNDFQPKPIRSVSCGDVVVLPDGSLHKVLGAGFESLPAGTDINSLPRGVRASIC